MGLVHAVRDEGLVLCPCSRVVCLISACHGRGSRLKYGEGVGVGSLLLGTSRISEALSHAVLRCCLRECHKAAET
jgi:hypothetical protein